MTDQQLSPDYDAAWPAVDHEPGDVRWTNTDDMDAWVQAALNDPRAGDIFHEMYSYGVQVIAVSPDEVYWRSFSTRTHDVGFATREEWATGFRYGDHMPGKHTMHLQRRGVIPPGQGASGG